MQSFEDIDDVRDWFLKSCICSYIVLVPKNGTSDVP